MALVFGEKEQEWLGKYLKDSGYIDDYFQRWKEMIERYDLDGKRERESKEALERDQALVRPRS